MDITELIKAAVIDIVNQTQPQSQPFLSAGEWVVIVAAVIAAIASICAVVSTNKSNKKINETVISSSEKTNETVISSNEKINKANIEANLIAKARIEWIQNVRNTTAELIATFYLMLNQTDAIESLKLFTKAKEKVELLILYFGPEDRKEETTTNILDEKINAGKNNLIVSFLILLLHDFREHNESVEEKIIPELKTKLENASRELSENITGIEFQEDIEIDGKTYTSTENTYEAVTEKKYNDVLASLHHMKKIHSIYEEKLMELRDIIRIYLKLEWNQAKKGQ